MPIKISLFLKLYNKQVEELTENKHILSKYTISLFEENIVSQIIKISQVSPVPISQKHF